MAVNFYPATSTTGGATGSLDSINGDLLNDGDAAVVESETKGALFYVLDATSGAAESGDDVIAPDLNPGTKRWLKLKLQAADPTDANGVGDRGFNDLRYYLRTESEYETIFIVAGAMIPRTTNGATAGTNEYATNDVMYDYKAFDGATEEFVAFNFPMPEAWDRSTVKVKFFWAPGSSACTAGDTVEWEIAGLAVSDDDAIDTAYGTAQVISDTVLAGKDADMHITSATPALTVGGTPALGDMVQWTVSRNVSGTDDMTEDAWLFGVLIQLKRTNTVAAW
jgi:hypothetical protein